MLTTPPPFVRSPSRPLPFFAGAVDMPVAFVLTLIDTMFRVEVCTCSVPTFPVQRLLSLSVSCTDVHEGLTTCHPPVIQGGCHGVHRDGCPGGSSAGVHGSMASSKEVCRPRFQAPNGGRPGRPSLPPFSSACARQTYYLKVVAVSVSVRPSPDHSGVEGIPPFAFTAHPCIAQYRLFGCARGHLSVLKAAASVRVNRRCSLSSSSLPYFVPRTRRTREQSRTVVVESWVITFVSLSL